MASGRSAVRKRSVGQWVGDRERGSWGAWDRLGLIMDSRRHYRLCPFVIARTGPDGLGQNRCLVAGSPSHGQQGASHIAVTATALPAATREWSWTRRCMRRRGGGPTDNLYPGPCLSLPHRDRMGQTDGRTRYIYEGVEIMSSSWERASSSSAPDIMCTTSSRVMVSLLK